jgi:hypothetical protein
MQKATRSGDANRALWSIVRHSTVHRNPDLSSLQRWGALLFQQVLPPVRTMTRRLGTR